MKKTKLLIVVNELWFFYSHRLPLALGALKEDFDVYIVANGDTDLEDKVSKLGLKFHEVQFSRSSINPFKELRVLISLFNIYRKITPDIVHHVTIKPIIYGGIIARIVKTKSVVNSISGLGHVFISQGLVSSVRKVIVKILYRNLFKHNNVRAILQNPEEREMLSKYNIIGFDRSFLIRGAGVDLEAFFPKVEPPEPIVVTLAARMIWEKGVGVYVNAIKILKNKGIKAKFILAGGVDYDYPGFIKKSVLDNWHESGIVTWVGHHSDVSKLYQESHIVCLPSFYSEGVPKSLIEAAACGRPIVTTDKPGCREIVIDKFNGLLVKPCDAESLAHALETLIKNKNLRIEYGKNGRKLVSDDFEVGSVVKSTLNVYADVMHN